MKKLLILIIFLMPVLSFAQEIEDYLIQTNIGEYVFRPKRVITIQNAGILVQTGHFPGHGDMTYEGIYIHPQTYLGVTVQITQHAGSDSDKWLLHEVEDSYRKNPEQPNFRGVLRDINGNKIFTYARGTHYSWVSNYVVVDIKYTDLQLTKPEPLDVVTAYLQKFPSTIPAMVMDTSHDVQWIKDEMERRLWLCDKWFLALQQGKAEMKDVLQNTVDSMQVFLDYREKYYGIKAQDEKLTLQNALVQNNGTAIKSKLTEYKTWWNENKGKAITVKG